MSRPPLPLPPDDSKVKPVDSFDRKIERGLQLVSSLRLQARTLRYDLGRAEKLPEELKAGIQRAIVVVEDAAETAERKLRHMKEVLRGD